MDPSNIKTVNVDDRDNYYFPNICQYPGSDFFVGFPPFFNKNKKQNGIYLILSQDGHHFKKSHQLIQGDFWLDRNNIHSVNGLVISSDQKEIYLYAHHNYFGADKKSPEIHRYSIRMDGFTSIYSNDGYFIIKMELFNEKLVVNYRCQNDGYIKVYFDDEEFEQILTGDELEYLIHVDQPAEYYVKIELKNAEIFSLSY